MHNHKRVDNCVNILTYIEQVASDSMPIAPETATIVGQDAHLRWVAERNRRTALLVQLYCASDVASSIGGIGPV